MFLKEKGLGTQCEFINNTPDIISILKNSTISIFPMNKLFAKVDIPIALLESMALGVPVICSDIQPINEIKLADTSCIIPFADLDSFKEKIIQFLSDNRYYNNIARKNQDQFNRYYCSEIISKSYMELYDEIERNYC